MPHSKSYDSDQPEGKDQVESKSGTFSRRKLLAGAAGLAAATAVGGVAAGQTTTPTPTGRSLGGPATELGERSSHELLQRLPGGAVVGGPSYATTPLADLDGIITPTDLFFEVNHQTRADLDPAEYKLMVHGMVERPTVFTLDDLKRFPRVSRIAFLECAGNGLEHLIFPSPDYTAQVLAGFVSCAEWFGVPLTTIFQEVGVKPEATWALFEGGDAALMTLSWPMERLWYGEGILAYGMNGEALRPANGYPLRLFVPGTEGNANVKWLRRIEFGDQPWQSEKETNQYSDIRCEDGKCVVNQFTFTMDAKSLITWPSGGRKIPKPGWWEISGLAWSGRGAIDRVEVSTDNGQTWRVASLDQPVLPRAFTRFRHLWNWDGSEAMLMSRAIDNTGYVQPTREELLAWGRSQLTYYHVNAIIRWQVDSDGSVTSGDVV
jgi:sulfane dehydrogenase subunit SoxC